MSTPFALNLKGTEPVPQGSKTAFVNKTTGRAIVTDANKTKLKPFREMVAAAAVEKVEEIGWVIPQGPVELSVTFFFARPKSHFHTDGRQRRDAPFWKHTKPDIDKLLRSLLDSLTGVVFRDDSQVASIAADKQYVPEGGQVGLSLLCYAL